jgi:hypothetical protein
MFRHWAAAALLIAAAGALVGAQTRKPAGAKPEVYDLTITTDGTPYSGTLTLVVAAAQVGGEMRISKPTEVTGKVAGTVKAGEMALDFPYRMVQRNCDGQIAMAFKAPVKGAGSKGTVSITGCGRDAANKLAGTVELSPKK